MHSRCRNRFSGDGDGRKQGAGNIWLHRHRINIDIMMEGMTMNIRDIRAVGLRGATPEGGWSNEIQPDDCVHTLIAVLTDQGLIGYGSLTPRVCWRSPQHQAWA